VPGHDVDLLSSIRGRPIACPTAPSSSGTLIEMTSEMTSFSSAPADTSKFTPPAGFKEVEHSMKKVLRDASK